MRSRLLPCTASPPRVAATIDRTPVLKLVLTYLVVPRGINASIRRPPSSLIRPRPSHAHYTDLRKRLPRMPIKSLGLSQQAPRKAARLRLLERRDGPAGVRARAGPDRGLEETAELAEARAVGPARVPEPAVPADAVVSGGECGGRKKGEKTRGRGGRGGGRRPAFRTFSVECKSPADVGVVQGRRSSGTRGEPRGERTSVSKFVGRTGSARHHRARLAIAAVALANAMPRGAILRACVCRCG